GLTPERVGTLELQLAREPARVDRSRVVAARVDARAAVAVDLPVERIERGGVRLARKQGRLLGGRERQLLRGAEVLAARSDLRDRRLELLLGRLAAVRPLLAELLVEGRHLPVERGEGGVGLLLVTLDHRTDRLADGLADRVAALEVILRVGDTSRVVAAERDPRRGGRRGRSRGRRAARRRRGGGRAARDRRVRAAAGGRAAVGGARVSVVAVRRAAGGVAAGVRRAAVVAGLRELDRVVAAHRTRRQASRLSRGGARRQE